MDDAAFQALMAKMGPSPAAAEGAPQATAPGASPQGTVEAAPQEAAPAAPSDPIDQAATAYAGPATAEQTGDMAAYQEEATKRAGAAGTEEGLGNPGLDPAAPLAGAAEAVFQTKDFLLGAPAPDQRNPIRAAIEDGIEKLPVRDKLAAGITQFAVGMLGAGKLVAAGKVVPWLATGIKAAEASKGGLLALESAKAAAVGAVAFDPASERFSNMIQGSPLANPITGFLAAKPEDSRAVGRMKNAMESIGLDATLIGAFIGSTQVWKALRSGDKGLAAKWAGKTEKALAEPETTVTPLPPEEQRLIDEGYYTREEWAAATPDQKSHDLRERASADEDDAAYARRNQARDITGEPVGEAPYAGSYVDNPYDWNFGNVKQDGQGERTANTDLTPETSAQADAVADEMVKLSASLPPHTDEFGQALRDLDDGKPVSTDRLVAHIKDKEAAHRIVAEGGADAPQGLQDLWASENPETWAAIQRIFELREQHATLTTEGRLLPNKAGRGGGPSVDLPGRDADDMVLSAANDRTPPDAVSEAPAGESTTQVQTPTQGAAAEGVNLQGQPTGAFKRPGEEDVDVDAIVDGLRADTDAVEKYGSVYNAISEGHAFGKGRDIPWQALNSPEEVDMLTARFADAIDKRIQKTRGGKAGGPDGGVMSDPEVLSQASKMARTWGIDPSLLLGQIQQAGKQARSMAAMQDAGFLVVEKLRQETYKMGSKIAFGDFAQWGGDQEAAKESLKTLSALMADTLSNTLAIRAAGGRIVRRNQGGLARLDPALLKATDGDALVKLIMQTGGDPAEMAKVVNPKVLAVIGDYAKYVLVNNLVSGIKTQIVNTLTNGYMVGVRPVEKMIGSSMQGAYGRITGNAEIVGSSNRQFREARRMYGYMAANLQDSWSQASAAFKANDSIMTPHQTELFKANLASTGPVQWKTMDSVPNLLHNALMVTHTAIGLPTRGLGFVDELVKQTVYRGKLGARAADEGIQKGMEQGLRGDKLKAFVKEYTTQAIDAGFDEFGHGIDADALREAKIATFQQDLQPGTFGKQVQNMANSNRMIGLVVPFIKTPTNVLRYGWKLSPGLNLLQSEFRQSLTGVHGADVQAEAIGQMTLGTLFAATAATAVADGRITGGGPVDPKAKAELMATGWQPYSVVREKPDGTRTYIPFGRYDPVGMPFGMVADIIDGMHASEGENFDVGSASMGVVLAMSKQFRDKTYLLNVSQFMDAMFDDDPAGEKAQRFFSNMGANFVPYSAMMRQVNPDNTLHEARGVVDKVMATVPGWSTEVPVKHDAWGDPVTAYSRNIFSSDDEGGIVDREMQRMGLETGATITPVAPRPQGDVDLRDLTMKDGRNAYAVYSELAGHLPGTKPLKELAAQVIRSKDYRRLPDGDIETKGTKLYMLGKVVHQYRDAALNYLKRDPIVRDALLKKQRDVISQIRGGGAPKPEPQTGIAGLLSQFGLGGQ